MASRYSDFSLYKRIAAEARPYWTHLSGICLLSLLSAPLALLAPLPLKIAVDSVIGDSPLPPLLEMMLPAIAETEKTTALILAISLVVAVILLQQLQGFASWLLELSAGEKLALGFRSRLFGYVQQLSLSYHDTKGTADTLYRIQYDAPSVQYVAVQFVPFVTAWVTLGALVWVTAQLDFALSMVALAVSPALFLSAEFYRRRIRSRWAAVKELESATMSVAQEVLSLVRVVKAFGQEAREQQRFLQQGSRSVSAHIGAVFAEMHFGLLSACTIAVGTAAVLFIGVRHVQAGMLTLGELLMVMTYLTQLYKPLETISKKVTEMQASLASAERAFALLDELPEVAICANPLPLARARGSVIFEHVFFSYQTEERYILQDVSVQIEPGTCVGISGRSGAGKTTLVSLLTRFYDPSAGRILLDGADLREYDLADLRNQFAIVLQEPVLFSTTLAENIAYGRPSASEQDIIDAAKAANIHDSIVSLPDGYRTEVGERGMRLSGGERQRISLARAFLKNAPILILDEPTSSVDVNSEAAITEAMGRLMRGRTTFMIAHRLTTLEKCDVRLHLEQGRVVTLDREIPTAIRSELMLERCS